GVADPARDGDLARRNRDHSDRRRGRLRDPRTGRACVRCARRRSGCVRRARRYDAAAAPPGAHAGVSLRRAARRDRDPAAPAMTYALAVALGVVAGILAGLFGVGGGILFVPTLTWLGLTQLHAEATSLLAIVPTVLVGVWRQQSYGNVRWRSALVIGLASVGATVGGAQVAESLPEHVLRKLFAVLLIAVAGQVAWQARRKQP